MKKTVKVNIFQEFFVLAVIFIFKQSNVRFPLRKNQSLLNRSSEPSGKQ